MIRKEEELFSENNQRKIKVLLNGLTFASVKQHYKKCSFWLDQLIQLYDEQQVLADLDPDGLLQEEHSRIKQQIDNSVNKITSLVKERVTGYFIELRAGTGGEEAAIFARELCEAYVKYLCNNQVIYELVSRHDSDNGGYKNIMLQVNTHKCYDFLTGESGVHRVQRVPVTESKGRVHTSTVTVAILPIKDINYSLSSSDITVDTYRSSGAGGQHTNTTDSAVRLTHDPTGIKAECQTERCQHKNKAKAIAVLTSKVHEFYVQQKEAEDLNIRRNMIGHGERNEKRRTYNFSQSRITDHTFNVTTNRLTEFLAGNIEILRKTLTS